MTRMSWSGMTPKKFVTFVYEIQLSERNDCYSDLGCHYGRNTFGIMIHVDRDLMPNP